MDDLHHGKTTGFGVAFKPGFDYDINPCETLVGKLIHISGTVSLRIK